MMEPPTDRMRDNIAKPLDRAPAGRELGPHRGAARVQPWQSPSIFRRSSTVCTRGRRRRLVELVTRDASVDDLVDAIRNALRGEVICPSRVSGLLFQRVAALSGATQA